MTDYDPQQSRVDLIAFLRARFAEDDPSGAWDGPGLREASRYELKRRAQRYADHPDYQPEWRP